MRYYLCRIGYNNYTLILTECQIKFFKLLNLVTIPLRFMVIFDEVNWVRAVKGVLMIQCLRGSDLIVRRQFQLLPTRRCAFILRLRLDFDLRLG